MSSETVGIHHVTGIAGAAQPAVDFYAGVLGLRFVKQTVNFEDITQHHLYFGDSEGHSGSVFTCFPDPHADPGRVGKPQVASVAFAVPEDSLEYWRSRLDDADIAAERADRFDERALTFRDPSGTPVELVAGASGRAAWPDGPVPDEAAIRGIAGVSVRSANPYATASALETVGFEYERENETRVRYRTDSERDTVVDIQQDATEFGREGPGTLHHVALGVPSEDDLHEWRKVFDERGYDVSRVKDRHFFHSLYVREPGGVLIELATETGGLVVGDSDPGNSLFLPEWFEPDRDLIESQLPDLAVPDGTPEAIGEQS